LRCAAGGGRAPGRQGTVSAVRPRAIPRRVLVRGPPDASAAPAARAGVAVAGAVLRRRRARRQPRAARPRRRRPDAAARRLRRAAPLGGPRPRGHRIARRLQPEGTAVTADPLDAALDRIAAAPDGPGVAAMFDFDGTIVHGYSGVHFFRDRLAAGKVGPRELLGTAVNGLRGTDSEAEFERF